MQTDSGVKMVHVVEWHGCASSDFDTCSIVIDCHGNNNSIHVANVLQVLIYKNCCTIVILEFQTGLFPNHSIILQQVWEYFLSGFFFSSNERYFCWTIGLTHLFVMDGISTRYWLCPCIQRSTADSVYLWECVFFIFMSQHSIHGMLLSLSFFIIIHYEPRSWITMLSVERCFYLT